MIEKIEHSGELLAIIIRDSYEKSGLNFVTDKNTSFQVGFHNVEKGKRYKAHISLPFEKLENFIANKIYYVKEGKIMVDVYNKQNEKVKDVELNKGDLILFVCGGHGVDVMDNAKLIEIKQGPYRGVEDEKKFLE